MWRVPWSHGPKGRQERLGDRISPVPQAPSSSQEGGAGACSPGVRVWYVGLPGDPCRSSDDTQYLWLKLGKGWVLSLLARPCIPQPGAWGLVQGPCPAGGVGGNSDSSGDRPLPPTWEPPQLWPAQAWLFQGGKWQMEMLARSLSSLHL